MPKEAKVIFLAFIYFANLHEHNNEIDKDLLKLYRRLGKLTLMYKYDLDNIVADINEVIKDYPPTDIDILLASVTIIAEYYDQTKGGKRLFTPMSHSDILDLQDELLGQDYDKDTRTLDFCHFAVKALLA